MLQAWDKTLKQELIADEGLRDYPYSDTKGLLTIGIGHNLHARPLSAEEIDLIYTADVVLVIGTLDQELAWWRKLPEAPQRVLVNLCFNMGWGTLREFKRFLEAMENEDWKYAAEELRASAWWKQVGARGPRTVNRLLGVS